jgi:hypothetical protein
MMAQMGCPPIPRLMILKGNEGRTVIACFVGAAFLSSGLLFTLEPMVGKLMLPLLGGSPAVWNTCLLFFQAMLLAGYAYVHFGIRWLGIRRHAAVHVALVALSLLFIPPHVGAPEPPADGSPVGWLLLLLVRTIGLPFFVISATAPLVQRWLAGSAHPSGRDPYFLYAASNLGSLTGLVLYPFVLEPLTGLRGQAFGWSATYGLFTVLLASLALWARRSYRVEADPAVHLRAGDAAHDAEPQVAHAAAARWTAVAFVPSALLLAVTGYVTTDVAPMPLLWLLPLALYLATFVAAFGARGGRAAVVARVAQPLVVVIVLVAVLQSFNPVWMLLLHLAALTLASYVGHRRLAAERPPAANLTTFYLWLSVGGALGGVFGALLAPVLLMPETEYAVLLTASLLLPARRTATDLVPQSVSWVIIAASLLAAAVLGAWQGASWALGALLPAIGVLLLRFESQRFAMAAAVCMAVLAAVPFARRSGSEGADLARERNFFGTLRVRDMGGYHRLVHGRTLHGTQSTDPALALKPTTYYTREGPLGDVFALLAERGAPAHIGVVGLGVGTAVCHTRPGYSWDLYEIDPAVVNMARDPRLFTYVESCAPGAEIIIGDGRRSLELRSAVRYDLLVLDAFSSDAIPAHLLTREAFELYADRLADDGLLAVHISNRYLDLAPVIAANARDLGLAARIRRDKGTKEVSRTASIWVAVGRDQALMRMLDESREWMELEARSRFRTWTDDYTNLLAVLGVWKPH